MPVRNPAYLSSENRFWREKPMAVLCCGVRRLGIGAVESGCVTNLLDTSCIQTRAGRVDHLTAAGPIRAVDLDLDQFMRLERLVHFGDDGVAQSGCARFHDWFQVMRLTLQRALIGFGVVCHGLLRFRERAEYITCG